MVANGAIPAEPSPPDPTEELVLLRVAGDDAEVAEVPDVAADANLNGDSSTPPPPAPLSWGYPPVAAENEGENEGPPMPGSEGPP